MARPLIDVLQNIDRKVRSLTLQRDALRSEVEDLKSRLDELSRSLQDEIREKERLMMEARFLSMSHRLADSPDALVEARRTINALIRKIDRCIVLLNDDPQM